MTAPLAEFEELIRRNAFFHQHEAAWIAALMEFRTMNIFAILGVPRHYINSGWGRQEIDHRIKQALYNSEQVYGPASNRCRFFILLREHFCNSGWRNSYIEAMHEQFPTGETLLYTFVEQPRVLGLNNHVGANSLRAELLARPRNPKPNASGTGRCTHCAQDHKVSECPYGGSWKKDAEGKMYATGGNPSCFVCHQRFRVHVNHNSDTCPYVHPQARIRVNRECHRCHRMLGRCWNCAIVTCLNRSCVAVKHRLGNCPHPRYEPNRTQGGFWNKAQQRFFEHLLRLPSEYGVQLPRQNVGAIPYDNVEQPNVGAVYQDVGAISYENIDHPNVGAVSQNDDEQRNKMEEAHLKEIERKKETAFDVAYNSEKEFCIICGDTLYDGIRGVVTLCDASWDIDSQDELGHHFHPACAAKCLRDLHMPDEITANADVGLGGKPRSCDEDHFYCPGCCYPLIAKLQPIVGVWKYCEIIEGQHVHELLTAEEINNYMDRYVKPLKIKKARQQQVPEDHHVLFKHLLEELFNSFVGADYQNVDAEAKLGLLNADLLINGSDITFDREDIRRSAKIVCYFLDIDPAGDIYDLSLFFAQIKTDDQLECFKQCLSQIKLKEEHVRNALNRILKDIKRRIGGRIAQVNFTMLGL